MGLKVYLASVARAAGKGQQFIQVLVCLGFSVASLKAINSATRNIMTHVPKVGLLFLNKANTKERPSGSLPG